MKVWMPVEQDQPMQSPISPLIQYFFREGRIVAQYGLDGFRTVAELPPGVTLFRQVEVDASGLSDRQFWETFAQDKVMQCVELRARIAELEASLSLRNALDKLDAKRMAAKLRDEG